MLLFQYEVSLKDLERQIFTREQELDQIEWLLNDLEEQGYTVGPLKDLP